ncbi:MAG: Hsp70 family protein [Pseudonocardiaceae bacterium]
MSYWLGIDVGTTFTAAAICREVAGRRPLPEVIPLGSRGAAVSSVVYLSEDGQVVVGEAAERRAVTDSDRVVREFKRRIGDEVPMMIGGVPHSASEIAAMVVRWVVDRVAEREGEPARGITITHPASWGTYKTRIMADALRAADLSEVMFRTEPEAAAASYSMQERVATGSTIAVYDLGGGTFDAAVVCKDGIGMFSVLGLPQGIDRLGGVDFDDAVFGHVVAKVPALSELDPEDPATLTATARLRRECTEAKEALSADTEVTISVLAPEVQSQLRLVRAEFEDLIRPQVAETVEALRRALRSADVGPEDLDAVLLVGGSSRVPLVAQLVSAELGRPVAVDADPTAAIALGAALFALPTGPAESDTASADVPTDTQILAVSPDRDAPTVVITGLDVPERSPMEVPDRPTLTVALSDIEPADLERRRARSRQVKQVAAAGLLTLVLAGGATAVPYLSSRSGSIPPADAGTSGPATSTAAPAPALVPDIPHPVPEAGSGSDGNSGSDDSSGTVRTTPTAAPPAGAGTGAKAGATVPATPPATPWTTSWRTSWTRPPSSSSPPPPPSTTSPPTTTTTTTTANAPPPTTTTTAPPPATTTRTRPPRPTTRPSSDAPE